MTRFTKQKIRSLRAGFYTVEAAVFLPLVLLAVFTLGYFLEADSAWENTLHAAYDESSFSQVYGKDLPDFTLRSDIRSRACEECPETDVTVSPFLPSYSDGTHYDLCFFGIKAETGLSMPLGFGHVCKYKDRVKFRKFTGLKYERPALGAEGLETDTDSSAVWIFPQSGTKYHKENCTYVRATVHSCILTDSLKRKYSPCEMCDSGGLSAGSIVFCFSGDDTCYHRGSCRSIKRHSIVIDRNEAEKKGYTPCSKCGG